MELEAGSFPARHGDPERPYDPQPEGGGKGITLVESIDANVPFYVVGDETRIQVLMNLTGNAIKVYRRKK